MNIVPKCSQMKNKSTTKEAVEAAINASKTNQSYAQSKKLSTISRWNHIPTPNWKYLYSNLG